MSKKSSVLAARILLVVVGAVCAWSVDGWWWLLLLPAAPFFVGFVSSLLERKSGGGKRTVRRRDRRTASDRKPDWSRPVLLLGAAGIATLAVQGAMRDEHRAPKPSAIDELSGEEAATGQPEPSLHRFHSVDGRFSVRMPGKTTEESRTVDTPEYGPQTTHLFIAESADGFFTVSYVDYPQKMVEERSAETILDQVRDGFAQGMTAKKGRLVSAKGVSFQGYQGRSLEGEQLGGQSMMRARVFLVGRRLYQVAWGGTKDRAFSAPVAQFLESFVPDRNDAAL